MYLLKFIILTMAVIALFAGLGTARAEEEEPQRHILIRAWRGDALVSAMQFPLIPGQPATMLSGDGGPKVPEGMVPPPLKVSSLVCVRIVGSADTLTYPSLDQTDAALAKGNHFVVADVDIRLLERDADRFAAVIFDQTVSAKPVALPAELAFSEDDQDLVPEGVITAWVSGSLVPMQEPVFIDQEPAQPSITLPADAN